MTVPPFRRRFRPSPGLVSAAAAWVVAVTGGLVLVAWWAGASELTRPSARWHRMAPNTALAFVLAGTSLRLLRREPVSRNRRVAGAACAGAVLLVGLATFAERALGIDLRIDRALLGDVSPADAGSYGRMAIQSSLCFAAVGLAILTLDTRWRIVATVTQGLVLLVTQITFLAVIGYLFGAPAFYGDVASVPNLRIALTTAVLFVLLGVGYLAVRPNRGMAALLLSRGPAGTVTRWLLLAPVVIPIVVVVFNAWAIKAGFYPRDLSGWATMLGFIFVFTLVIWWNASVLYRADVERVRGEAALRLANEQLAAANKELEAFSYSVSHDLRAPLRAVDGFSRILLEDYTAALPEDARNLLRDVRANALQMGRLVDDLLAFSKLSRQPVKAVTVDTADLVRQCLTELEPDHRGRRMTVRVAELPSCLGDPVLLKQVWMNLLANAIKYTAKRSEALIEVGAIHEPGRVGYYVKDNGVGFDMTYAHKLFGVFQRLHKAEDYPGTGVGLAVVQRIVHRHGGEVRADARPDAGATFVFTLPSEGTPT